MKIQRVPEIPQNPTGLHLYRIYSMNPPGSIINMEYDSLLLTNYKTLSYFQSHHGPLSTNDGPSHQSCGINGPTPFRTLCS